MRIFSFALCTALLAYSNWAFGSEAGMPQLNPEFWASQIFWLILIFSGLYFIIYKIFLPKIIYSLENRKSRVVDDLNEAQKLKENAEIKLEEYNKIIEDSKKEAKKIIDDNKRKLDRDIEIKKKKFNEEVEKELISTEKEIAALRKSSISDISEIASEISIEVINKIINVEVNKSNVSAIVDETIKRKVEKYI